MKFGASRAVFAALVVIALAGCAAFVPAACGALTRLDLTDYEPAPTFHLTDGGLAIIPSVQGRFVDILEDNAAAAFTQLERIEQIFAPTAQGEWGRYSCATEDGSHLVVMTWDWGNGTEGLNMEGRADVYVRGPDGLYEYRHVLYSPIPQEGANFGWRCGITPSHQLIISARFFDVGPAEDVGAVWHYSFDDEARLYTLTDRVEPSGLGADWYFGYDIDVGGEIFAISAPRDGFDGGVVFLYTAEGGTLVFIEKISDNVAKSFGNQVAIDGNHLLVSDPGDDDAGVDYGCVYVYTRHQGTGSYEVIPRTKTVPPTTECSVHGYEGCDYGGNNANSLVFRHGVAVVGAHQAHHVSWNTNIAEGRAFVYHINTSSNALELVQILNDGDPTTLYRFGGTCDTNGLIVACSNDDQAFIFVDSDCPSTVDSIDDDGDGVVCGDCNDFYPTVFPGANETCDGLDNDCNEQTFDGFHETGEPCDGPDLDLCAEGVYFCSNAVLQCTDVSGNSDELCNGEDDDCDGKTDEGFDKDGDGVKVCGSDGDPATIEDNDCNDENRLIFPGAIETCNSEDDDCNGITDEGFDEDGDTYTVCGADGDPATTIDNDCNDTNTLFFPGAAEFSGNMTDFNCDGKITCVRHSDCPGRACDKDQRACIDVAELDCSHDAPTTVFQVNRGHQVCQDLDSELFCRKTNIDGEWRCQALCPDLDLARDESDDKKIRIMIILGFTCSALFAALALVFGLTLRELSWSRSTGIATHVGLSSYAIMDIILDVAFLWTLSSYYKLIGFLLGGFSVVLGFVLAGLGVWVLLQEAKSLGKTTPPPAVVAVVLVISVARTDLIKAYDDLFGVELGSGTNVKLRKLYRWSSIPSFIRSVYAIVMSVVLLKACDVPPIVFFRLVLSSLSLAISALTLVITAMCSSAAPGREDVEMIEVGPDSPSEPAAPPVAVVASPDLAVVPGASVTVPPTSNSSSDYAYSSGDM